MISYSWYYYPLRHASTLVCVHMCSVYLDAVADGSLSAWQVVRGRTHVTFRDTNSAGGNKGIDSRYMAIDKFV